MDIYFRQFWNDPRLKFDSSSGISKLVLDGKMEKHIWVPDTFFVNSKMSIKHDATVPNIFLRILDTGDVLRSER